MRGRLDIANKYDSELNTSYDVLITNIKDVYKPKNRDIFSKLLGGVTRGVYVVYSASNEIIYIGKSDGLADRINGHICRLESKISDDADKIGIISEDSFERFRCSHDACGDIEYYLIEKEMPIYNKRHGNRVAYDKECKNTQAEEVLITGGFTIGAFDIVISEEQQKHFKKVKSEVQAAARNLKERRLEAYKRIEAGEDVDIVLNEIGTEGMSERQIEELKMYGSFRDATQAFMSELINNDITYDFLNYMIKRADFHSVYGRSRERLRNIINNEFEKIVLAKANEMGHKVREE